jgi:hypothetical protein
MLKIWIIKKMFKNILKCWRSLVILKMLEIFKNDSIEYVTDFNNKRKCWKYKKKCEK